eukprot:superscaffoldBa00011100_g25051
MESTESRYAHLLQPIRELTKNWEIDLDDMCITFDGGKTRLNFAEAALLIQGSACIYSKKQLPQGILGNVVHRLFQFTPLDIDASENSEKADSNTTVSVAPLPPESLIPPETHEKQKLPLISLRGDVLCSQKDFRINLFIPGDEDLILLTLGSTAARFLLGDDQQQQQRVPDAASLIGGEAAAADVADAGGDAAEENFLPLEDDNGMELDQDPEEHVERHQGVVVSDEELRRTFLQPEEAGPQQQQGEEPVDGFRHPDLLGKNNHTHTLRFW